jgi:hypothetical protein
MKYGTNKSSFITLSFAHHKGIDAINIGNILHQTSIKSIVPTLVKDQYISILHLISDPIHCEVYSIQHYEIRFVIDLQQVGGFLRVLRFPPPIKLTAAI